MENLLAFWLFAVGGAVGSFLNVVVYRMPRRMSLVLPGSHCPACKRPIRWHDNIPIFGWIMLRGRCRDCGAWISMRYPLVEAITAGMFLLLAVVEGFSCGANLPLRPVAVVDATIYPALGLAASWGMVAYHLVLLSTLLAAALVEYDGHVLPWQVALPAVLVGWWAPVAWPYLHPVPAWHGVPDVLAGVVDGTAGSALGIVVGEAARRLLGPPHRLGLLLGPACVGLFLGWQAAAALGLLVAAAHFVMQLAGRWWPGVKRTSPGLWLLAGTLAWILAWEAIVRWCPLLG